MDLGAVERSGVEHLVVEVDGMAYRLSLAHVHHDSDGTRLAVIPISASPDAAAVLETILRQCFGDADGEVDVRRIPAPDLDDGNE